MNKNVALTAASGMMGGLNLTELDEMSKKRFVRTYEHDFGQYRHTSL